jgi:hypothetical protein
LPQNTALGPAPSNKQGLRSENDIISVWFSPEMPYCPISFAFALGKLEGFLPFNEEEVRLGMQG